MPDWLRNILLAGAAAAAQTGTTPDEGHNEGGEGPYTAVLEGEEGMEIVEYVKVGPIAVVQGDVDIGDHADLQQETLRNLRLISASLDASALGLDAAELAKLRAAFGDAPPRGAVSAPDVVPFGLGVSPERPWPNRTLVYELHPSITDAVLKQRIADAARIWTSTGLVTVRPRRAGDTVRVAIIKSSSELGLNPNSFYCSSKAGYVTENRIFLSNKCEKYTVVHEFGHALGLLHEHGRADRTTLLRIDMSKIKRSYRSQYGTVSGNYHGTRHDLCSLMHYGRTASSRATTTGRPEIWYTPTRAGTAAMAQCAATLRNQGDCGPTAPRLPGQRCALSPSDRATIGAMYPVRRR
jgi:hypothetical protein